MKTILFFDTETTGLPRDHTAPPSDTANWPRMVQLAWIVSDYSGNVQKRRSVIIKPVGFTIPADASRLHGITTDRALREGAELSSTLSDFYADLAAASHYVGHNVDFDIHVVAAELCRMNRSYSEFDRTPHTCTMMCSVDFCKLLPLRYGEYKWPKLQELYSKLFGRVFDDAHDAAADITATKECYFEMVRRGMLERLIDDTPKAAPAAQKPQPPKPSAPVPPKPQPVAPNHETENAEKQLIYNTNDQITMIKCSKGHENSGESNFCMICGEPLYQNCECGMKRIPKIARFCPNCGKDLSAEIFTVNGVSFKMIKVDGGTFTMGATPEQGDDAYNFEKPAHQVTLSDYYIGQTEVTQALWQAVMGSNPSYFKGDSRPVENVSWDDCQAFIKRLNALTGKKFSLPTEAQWEFAARGGNKSKGYKYAGGDKPDEVAWYDDNSGKQTHDVATKQPNELGLYDMSGNVFEWCSDWYGSYSSAPQTNPAGPSSGSDRVLRGGSWSSTPWGCRLSNRGSDNPDYGYRYLGFRLSFLVKTPI